MTSSGKGAADPARPGQFFLPVADVKCRRELYPRSGTAGISPDGGLAPTQCGEAKQAGAEQCDSRRLWNCGREFGDHDLAIAALEIGNQDLVGAPVKGATTATWVNKTEAATMGGTGAATAAITSAPTGTAKATSTASAPTEAAAGSACAPGETGECATTVSRGASAEKTTAATAATAAVTTITTGAAKGVAGDGAAAAAVRTGETTLAGSETPATATTAGDDERRVTGTDHKSASTTATTVTRATCAADGDLESFPGGQAKIAADLGASTACAHKDTVSALRAKGEDLISVGGRHREGDEATGIREVEWHGVGGRP
jgi:hypothetical protein